MAKGYSLVPPVNAKDKRLLPVGVTTRLLGCMFGQTSSMRALGLLKEKRYDMKGKTVLITGANGGIGFTAAKAICSYGANVIFACRREDAANEAMKTIKTALDKAKNKVDFKMDFVPLDLSNKESVRNCASATKAVLEKLGVEAIDVILLNAGVAPLKNIRIDGVESGFATNVLGNYLFSTEMIDNGLLKSGGRVVVVTGDIYVRAKNSTPYFDGSPAEGYDQSKLGLNWTILELQKKYDASGVNVNFALVHPGVAMTNLFNGGIIFSLVKRMLFVDAEKGAKMMIYCTCENDDMVPNIGKDTYYHNTYGLVWFSKGDQMLNAKRRVELFQEVEKLARA